MVDSRLYFNDHVEFIKDKIKMVLKCKGGNFTGAIDLKKSFKQVLISDYR